MGVTIGEAIGSGLFSCIIFFPLMYFLLKSQQKITLAAPVLVPAFFLCVILVGFGQMYLDPPANASLTYTSIASSLILPLIICGLVIWASSQVERMLRKS